MKQFKNLFALIAVALLGLTQGASVFAANNYGIEYNGGEALGTHNNVQIDPDLVEGLTTLVKTPVAKTTFSDKWKQGFSKKESPDGECFEVKYVDISNEDPINEEDNLSVTFDSNEYSIKIDFLRITLDGVTDNNKKIPISIRPNYTSIIGSWVTFSDSTCNTRTGDLNADPSNNERIFAEMNIKLYRKGQAQVFASDNLYFGLTDIDARQSYKILNSDNMFLPSNMFAKNAEDLQPADLDIKNMYVESGNYIYSQYDNNGGIDTPDNSNIYVKLTKNTQQEGLNIVFGYAGSAGSAIEYYAKQYTVNYESDENGEITGIDTEQVISGENPSGTEQEPHEGYEDKTWIANTDVELIDGTIIKKGDPITAEQIKTVKVNQDITFTILHIAEPAPAVPDTGASTKNTDAATIATVSVFGVISLALIIRMVPQITRKRVKFE